MDSVIHLYVPPENGDVIIKQIYFLFFLIQLFV